METGPVAFLNHAKLDLFGSTSLSNSGGIVVDGGSSTLRLHQAVDLSDTSSVVVQNGATLEVLPATSTIADSGVLTVTGAGSRLQGNLSVTIGGNNALTPARVQVLNGGEIAPTLPGDSIEFVSSSSSFAEMIVDGAGSSYDTGTAALGVASTLNSVASLQVTGGGSVTVGSFLGVALNSGAAGTIDVSGGTLTVDTDATLANSVNSSATIQVSGGGLITVGNSLDVATTTLSTATIDLAGGTLTVGSDATLAGAGGGTAVVNVFPGGVFDIQGQALVGTGATLNIFGGELRLTDFPNLQINGGTFEWNSGTMRSTGNSTLNPSIAALLLPTGTIEFGKKLQVDGNLTLQSILQVNGGYLAVGGLINKSLLQLSTGTFEWLNSELIVGVGGPLGANIDLGPNLTIRVNGQLTNQGLITGDGTLVGDLSNQLGAEVRVEQGKSLDIVGAAHTNSGRIQLLGGSVEFAGSLTNTVGGEIVGRGTLITDGLTNAGQMLLSAGLTDAFGTVDITGGVGGGEIIVTGLGTATFYDDVTHNGDEIRTSAGSATIFFGDVSGSGPYTGTGQVFYEGTFSPGNSSAEINFGGDMTLTSSATLEIELGGTTPGTEFDTLDITGTAMLDGTLDVQLIDGFTPTAGDSFEIFSAGSLLGNFANITLPALPGDLLWFVNQTATTLELVSTFAADFDEDGDVDGSDLLNWEAGYGSGVATHMTGDANADLSAAGFDFLIWQRQYGSGVGAPLAATTATPEPTSACLLLMGLAIATLSRRR